MPRKSIPVLLAISFLLSACGPGELFGPTLTPTATATPIPTQTATPLPTATLTRTPIPTPIVYDGDWTGTTSAGGTIRFSIRDNNIVSFRVNFGYSTNNASCNVDSNTTISPGLPLSGNGFQIDIPALKIASVFDSPAAASGTLAASADSQRCKISVDLTWSAQKEP
jgi:hypothetical protein